MKPSAAPEKFKTGGLKILAGLWLVLAVLALANLWTVPAGSASIGQTVFIYVGLFLGVSLALAFAVSRWLDKRIAKKQEPPAWL